MNTEDWVKEQIKNMSVDEIEKEWELCRSNDTNSMANKYIAQYTSYFSDENIKYNITHELFYHLHNDFNWHQRYVKKMKEWLAANYDEIIRENQEWRSVNYDPKSSLQIIRYDEHLKFWKIPFIKSIRTQFGFGLKEAKDFVESVDPSEIIQLRVPQKIQDFLEMLE